MFYNQLIKNFPDCNIVEALPAENTSQINFKAPSYYTENIRELGAFIAACDLFIGADSGVMHLAAASGTTCVGLFSVTDSNAYEPYGNGSISVDINHTSTEQLINKIARLLNVMP